MSTFPAVLSVLSLASAADKGKLASGDAWLLLLDVIWQGQHIRLARNVDAVTFDAGDGAGPQSYQPFNFDLIVEKTSGGQLPTIQIKASNILGILQGAIEQYAGAVGATANVYFVNTAQPAGEPDLALSTTIMRTEVTAESVTFTLGAPGPQRQLFPRFLYRANFCMWAYKQKQCGYVGPLPTCSLTFDGPNGCEAHANQSRFGAFLGIGTNGAAIASQY